VRFSRALAGALPDHVPVGLSSALARVRERPVYQELRRRVKEIERLKAQC
jgi:hypothetical protein